METLEGQLREFNALVAGDLLDRVAPLVGEKPVEALRPQLAGMREAHARLSTYLSAVRAAIEAKKTRGYVHGC